MTLDEIRWMTELFKTGKMGKASENLYISQPALSQCLQRVENQLGFKLFERSNRGLEPTEKGKLFYQAAVKIGDTYDSFLAQAELLDKKELKDITIGMAPYLSSCCSADLIRSLNMVYPGLRFRIHEGFHPELARCLQNNTVQLIVVNEPLLPGDQPYHSFGWCPTVVFLRRGSPAAQFAYEENGIKYLDPKYLGDEPFCATHLGQATRQLTENIMHEAGIKPQIVHESRHISSLYRYAVEGVATGVSSLLRPLDEQDSLDSEQIIYRVPECYRWAYTRIAIEMRPDVQRLLPKGICQVIENAVIDNPLYGVQAERD